MNVEYGEFARSYEMSAAIRRNETDERGLSYAELNHAILESAMRGCNMAQKVPKGKGKSTSAKTEPGVVKPSGPTDSISGRFASDAVSKIYGDEMDRRSAILTRLQDRKSSAHAAHRLASLSCEEYQNILDASVDFFAKIAAKCLPKASDEAHAAVIASLVCTFGTDVFDMHERLAHTANAREDTNALIQSLPEYSPQGRDPRK
jgi:hypothetical protein